MHYAYGQIRVGFRKCSALRKWGHWIFISFASDVWNSLEFSIREATTLAAIKRSVPKNFSRTVITEELVVNLKKTVLLEKELKDTLMRHVRHSLLFVIYALLRRLVSCRKSSVIVLVFFYLFLLS